MTNKARLNVVGQGNNGALCEICSGVSAFIKIPADLPVRQAGRFGKSVSAVSLEAYSLSLSPAEYTKRDEEIEMLEEEETEEKFMGNEYFPTCVKANLD